MHFNCFIGSGHGSNIEKSFVLQKPIELKPGLNNISLLGATVGFPVIMQSNPSTILELFSPLNCIHDVRDVLSFPISTMLQDSGAYLEHRFAGVHQVTLKGLNTGTLDLSLNGWAHKVIKSLLLFHMKISGHKHDAKLSSDAAGRLGRRKTPCLHTRGLSQGTVGES